MKTLLYILQKEFIQVLRDKRMLGIIVMVPIIQMLILVYAANFDIKDVEMVVVDHDLSSMSRRLSGKFEGSSFFHLKKSTFSEKEAEAMIKSNDADFVLVIPSGFEREIMREDGAKIQMLFNAINGTAAEVSAGYALNVVADFNKKIICEVNGVPTLTQQGGINAVTRYWYNENLDYKHFMAPGILVILVTVIGMFLSGMNLVKEKEIGTIEQLNVTPIRKWQLIAGKLIPFWVIGLVDLSFGLLIARIAFHLPMVGNLGVLFCFAAVYLIGVLGAGLLISTFAESQQQVLFVGFFFMMIFMLMGGIFTSVESMPRWAQIVDIFNPVCYFMRVVRMVLLKGSGFVHITSQLLFVFIFGVFMLSFAVLKYRKRA